MTKLIKVHDNRKVIRGCVKNVQALLINVIWTDDFVEWYKANEEIITQIHQELNYASDTQMIVLEFINEDEATMFALRFA